MDDHDRGCKGREYVCSCGYDDEVEAKLARYEKALRGLLKACERYRLNLDAISPNQLSDEEIEARNALSLENDENLKKENNAS